MRRNDWHCGEGMRLLQRLQVAVYHLPEGTALAGQGGQLGYQGAGQGGILGAERLEAGVEAAQLRYEEAEAGAGLADGGGGGVEPRVRELEAPVERGGGGLRRRRGRVRQHAPHHRDGCELGEVEPGYVVAQQGCLELGVEVGVEYGQHRGVSIVPVAAKQG